MMSFEKRKLGQTDIELTLIVLGVMQFAGGEGFFGKVFPVLSKKEKNAIIAFCARLPNLYSVIEQQPGLLITQIKMVRHQPQGQVG